MWKLGQSEYILQVEMVSMEFSKYFFINYLYKKRSESITIGLVNLYVLVCLNPTTLVTVSLPLSY